MRMSVRPRFHEHEEKFELLGIGDESSVDVSGGQDAASDVKCVFRLPLLKQVEGAEKQTRFGNSVETVDEQLATRVLAELEYIGMKNVK